MVRLTVVPSNAWAVVLSEVSGHVIPSNMWAVIPSEVSGHVIPSNVWAVIPSELALSLSKGEASRGISRWPMQRFLDSTPLRSVPLGMTA